MTVPTHCKGCGKEFKRKVARKTGYCHACYMAGPHHANPDTRVKLSASMKARLADPNARAEHLERTRRGRVERLENDPEFREMVRQQGRAVGALRLGGQGAPAGSDMRKAAGRSVTRTKLADIPLEYREMHKKLRKQVGAKESRRLIADQHNADVVRFQRTGQLQQTASA